MPHAEEKVSIIFDEQTCAYCKAIEGYCSIMAEGREAKRASPRKQGSLNNVVGTNFLAR